MVVTTKDEVPFREESLNKVKQETTIPLRSEALVYLMCPVIHSSTALALHYITGLKQKVLTVVTCIAFAFPKPILQSLGCKDRSLTIVLTFHTQNGLLTLMLH